MIIMIATFPFYLHFNMQMNDIFVAKVLKILNLSCCIPTKKEEETNLIWGKSKMGNLLLVSISQKKLL